MGFKAQRTAADCRLGELWAIDDIKLATEDWEGADGHFVFLALVAHLVLAWFGNGRRQGQYEQQKTMVIMREAYQSDEVTDDGDRRSQDGWLSSIEASWKYRPVEEGEGKYDSRNGHRRLVAIGDED